MVRVKNESVTRGTSPSANKFSQLYFGDQTIGPESDGLNNILGFIEMGTRTDGRSDLKMVALRNDTIDNAYDASISVGWYKYGSEWAARATAPKPHASSTGGEIVTINYAVENYLKLDGSNNFDGDLFPWRAADRSYSTRYGVFRRIHDAASTASVGSNQDHFCLSGFNQGTLIFSGESGGSDAKCQTMIDAMTGTEDLALCADSNLDIFTGCGNTPDPSTFHHHIFRSNGNVELSGRLTLSSASMSQGLLLNCSSLHKGTNPTANTYFDIAFNEADGTASANRFGAVTCRVGSNGQVSTSLYAYKPVAGTSDYAQIFVAYDPDGNPFTGAPTPAVGDRSTKIATTACFDNEGFIGYKQLTSIQSVPGCFWFDSMSGLNIANNDLSMVQNADWIGLQIGMKSNNDKTQFVFNGPNMYKRSTDGAPGSETWTDWVLMADQSWVLSQLSTSGEETHICNLDQARVFKRSGNHLCGSVHVQMFRSLDTTGTHTDDYGIYVGSSRVATVTVIFQANKGGSSGHGRSIDIQLSGSFEVSANVPAGSQITLRRDTSNIPGDMRHAFAHVTVSNA